MKTMLHVFIFILQFRFFKEILSQSPKTQDSILINTWLGSYVEMEYRCLLVPVFQVLTFWFGVL